MDRAYYQLIEEANELTRLAVAVVKNADYKPCIKEATDGVIVESVKVTQYAIRTLTEVLSRQEYANAKSIS